MSNIANSLVQIGEAYVVDEVANDFNELALDLQKDLNLILEISQSYISLTQLVDELRSRHINKDILFPEKAVSELTQVEFNTVLAVITNSNPTDFLPPIASPYSSISFNPRLNTQIAQQIYTVPNYPNLDPRQSGRLVSLKPFDILKTPEVLKWLLSNSVNYGFLVYLDVGLYWIGKSALSLQLRQATNTNLIIGRFLKDPRQLIFLDAQTNPA